MTSSQVNIERVGILFEIEIYVYMLTSKLKTYIHVHA